MGLELHFHGPLVKFGRGDDGHGATQTADEGASSEERRDGDDGGSKAPLVGALVGLAVLVAVAVAVTSRGGGDGESEIPVDE